MKREKKNKLKKMFDWKPYVDDVVDVFMGATSVRVIASSHSNAL